MECECGRSPTKKRMGWHALSKEECKIELNKLQVKKAGKDVSENKD